MSEDLEKVKNRIRKLLALADRGNEHEAKVAIAKAQRLMLEYKLEQDDVVEKKSEVIRRETELYYTAYRNTYRDTLASLLADLYCCEYYIWNPKKSTKCYIAFIGLSADVDVLEDVVVFADECVNDWFKNFRKSEGWKYSAQYLNALKNTYGAGFAEGIADLLKEQLEEIKQEWGLIPVTPKEAKDFMASLTPLQKKEEPNYDFQNISCFTAGYKDGNNAEIQDKITTRNIDEKV